MHNVKEVKAKIHAAASSTRGRNILTFLIFLLISTGFWFIMALNDEVQNEFEVPLSVTGMPKDVMILSAVPSHLSVNIKDKSISLIRWEWGKLPHLDLDFSHFQNNGRTIMMNSTQLTGAVRSVFGGTANIVEIRPDSLALTYTTNPPVRKAIQIVADITASPQYTVNGTIELSSDSVSVYSLTTVPKNLVIHTDSVVLSNLTDTTIVTVPIAAPRGMKIIPSSVQMKIPVEPLIAKRKLVPVEVVDVPENVRVLPFPSNVEITYTVPISSYNRDDYQLKAIAPYRSKAHKLPLTLSDVPKIYNNTYLLTDSVEFLVERR